MAVLFAFYFIWSLALTQYAANGLFCAFLCSIVSLILFYFLSCFCLSTFRLSFTYNSRRKYLEWTVTNSQCLWLRFSSCSEFCAHFTEFVCLLFIKTLLQSTTYRTQFASTRFKRAHTQTHTRTHSILVDCNVDDGTWNWDVFASWSKHYRIVGSSLRRIMPEKIYKFENHISIQPCQRTLATNFNFIVCAACCHRLQWASDFNAVRVFVSRGWLVATIGAAVATATVRSFDEFSIHGLRTLLSVAPHSMAMHSTVLFPILYGKSIANAFVRWILLLKCTTSDERNPAGVFLQANFDLSGKKGRRKEKRND